MILVNVKQGVFICKCVRTALMSRKIEDAVRYISFLCCLLVICYRNLFRSVLYTGEVVNKNMGRYIPPRFSKVGPPEHLPKSVSQELKFSKKRQKLVLKMQDLFKKQTKRKKRSGVSGAGKVLGKVGLWR